MKPILIFSVFALLVVLVFHISCKKEYSCEGCIDGNKPPVANAGTNQTIILPKDSVVLDGSASTDPDGTIISYKWTKIAGPLSSAIIKADSSKTVVKALAMGVYKFELTVKDNGGLSAKDTVQIIVNDPAVNQPPVANAGGDQTITLPTDSVLLDGSASFDPDGTITSYKWTKITGAASSTIFKPDSAKTVVKSLTAGVYQFELKVTDNKGASGKDTVEVTVSDPNNGSGVTSLGCNSSMSTVSKLPTPGFVKYSVAAGNKVLFMRGNGAVDIYDTLSHNWETVTGMYATSTYLPDQTQYKIAKIGDKIIFSSMVDNINNNPSMGQIINIYNAVTNSWEITQVLQGRSFYQVAIAENKVYYVGGGGNIKKMDVYDALSNSWHIEFFDSARVGMSVFSFESKIYFAGGRVIIPDSIMVVCDEDGNCLTAPAMPATDRVDIWDVASNTWSVSYLSEGRSDMAVALLNNKIVFAGGIKSLINNSQYSETYSTAVDLYNTLNYTWSASHYGPSTSSMIEYNLNTLGIHTIERKLLIPLAGSSNKVHIYDDVTNSWSVAQMPFPNQSDWLERRKVAAIGSKLMFFNQYCIQPNHKYGGIDIFDASTNSWCHTQLNFDLTRMGVVKSGGSIYIAGGLGMIGCCSYNNPIDTLWRFNF